MRELRARLERAAGDDVSPDLTPLAATFLRGLSIGALVGAAIAGSAIFRRLRGPREEADLRTSHQDVSGPANSA